MTMLRRIASLPFYLCCLLWCVSLQAPAAPISFEGKLAVVDVDSGGAIYSGTSIGTTFTGFIDDVTANGSISNGAITTPFGCCIAAGGLSVSDNLILDADTATLLNTLMGSSMFSPGDAIDGIDLEGDAASAGGGRIEVGLSYVFSADTFANTDPGNYPFDPSDVLLALFFILEEAPGGTDIYSGLGPLSASQVVPLPAAAWLLGAGLLFLAGFGRRRGAG